MSYCRFSSDDFRCDLYCYADAAGGYTTHVAGNRIVGDIPRVPPVPASGDMAAWMEAHNRQSAFVQSAGRERIDLPHAGKTFNDPDLASFLARLETLREIGYVFPDHVLDQVREEMAEEPASGPA